jgi:diaminohydroxyphosphoribosylaminopyrimidine deaminase/5-amino-6-(5-phosphoribosylamino)uracil reductase
VLADDPMLTPRPPRGRKPLRIVLDTNLRIPLTSRLLRTAKNHPTMVIADTETVAGNAEKAERIKSKGAELLCVPISEGRCSLETVVYQLGQRGVTHLLVEGGAQVITSFLKEDLADEVCVYIAPKILGARGSTGLSESLSSLAQAVELRQVDVASFNEDVCLRGLTPRAAQDIGVEVMPEETGDAASDAGPEASQNQKPDIQ